MASGTAGAQTTTSYPVTATCSGGGQLCNNVATVPVATNGLLQAQFVSSSPVACSSIAIHFLVDGTQVAVTGFVAPGASSGFFNLGPVSPGTHTVGLRAEGEVGGCNVGVLGSWAGTVQITVDGVATSQPIPTLSAMGLIVLSALLGILAIRQLGVGMRRR
ncbi:MAG TPA: hypothetical protein VLU54_06635 [Casimicrobiaceae bacterium]|nr:hypothetical protein [Casimicrobiaceae bacterium]